MISFLDPLPSNPQRDRTRWVYRGNRRKVNRVERAQHVEFSTLNGCGVAQHECFNAHCVLHLPPAAQAHCSVGVLGYSFRWDIREWVEPTFRAKRPGGVWSRSQSGDDTRTSRIIRAAGGPRSPSGSPATSPRRRISNDDRNPLRLHDLRRQRVGCDTTSLLMVDMSVNLAGVALRNPVLAAAGTCGYVAELADVLDPARLGAIVTKSITREPREGHPPWPLRRLRELLRSDSGPQARPTPDCRRPAPISRTHRFPNCRMEAFAS